MVKRVCLVSSGTGGHLLPAVVLARALEQRGHDAVLVTEGRRAERVLLERFECRAETLSVGGGGIGAPLRMLSATRNARRFLRDEHVDIVVGTGGRTTVPVALAARSLCVPIALMEQNTVPGRANRWLAPLAGRVYLGLPARRQPRHSLITGTPVRPGFGGIERAAARRHLGLQPGVTVVLVTGGSQGARTLNQVVPDALCALRRELQVLHLGGDDDEAVRMRYAAGADDRLLALVRGYAFDMPMFYAAADLVICRGGGGTISELAAARRPAIILPYPHHRDRQQFHNGKLLERLGAAIVVDEADLTAAKLTAMVADLFQSGRLAEMGQRAAALCHHDSCGAILDDLHQWAALE